MANKCEYFKSIYSVPSPSGTTSERCGFCALYPFNKCQLAQAIATRKANHPEHQFKPDTRQKLVDNAYAATRVRHQR